MENNFLLTAPWVCMQMEKSAGELPADFLDGLDNSGTAATLRYFRISTKSSTMRPMLRNAQDACFFTRLRCLGVIGSNISIATVPTAAPVIMPFTKPIRLIFFAPFA